MSPTVAVRVDGGRLRFAQFTRVCKGATVRATVQPTEAGALRRLEFAVADAPGKLENLERALLADGASIATARRDDEAGTWEGTLSVPAQPLINDLLDRLHNVFGIDAPLELVFENGFARAQQVRHGEQEAKRTADRARVLLGTEQEPAETRRD